MGTGIKFFLWYLLPSLEISTSKSGLKPNPEGYLDQETRTWQVSPQPDTRPTLVQTTWLKEKAILGLLGSTMWQQIRDLYTLYGKLANAFAFFPLFTLLSNFSSKIFAKIFPQ